MSEVKLIMNSRITANIIEVPEKLEDESRESIRLFFDRLNACAKINGWTEDDALQRLPVCVSDTFRIVLSTLSFSSISEAESELTKLLYPGDLNCAAKRDIVQASAPNQSLPPMDVQHTDCYEEIAQNRKEKLERRPERKGKRVSCYTCRGFGRVRKICPSSRKSMSLENDGLEIESIDDVRIRCSRIRTRMREYQPGQQVWRRWGQTTDAAKAKSLITKWDGPFYILKKASLVNYEIRLTEDSTSSQIVHANDLFEARNPTIIQIPRQRERPKKKGEACRNRINKL